MAAVTPAQLQAFCGAAVPYAAALQSGCARFGIVTPLQQAHFLAQMAHESGGFKRTRENLNYSVQALLSMFGRHRISDADARRYGRTPDRPADQQAIANCLYGGQWGAKNLGNTEYGDGWLFIGRGLKQVTGRANYAAASKGLFGDDRLLREPQQLEAPDLAVLSAAHFWHSKSLNAPADADDVVEVTRIVNGGTIGLDERRTWLAKAKAVLL